MEGGAFSLLFFPLHFSPHGEVISIRRGGDKDKMMGLTNVDWFLLIKTPVNTELESLAINR